MKEYLEATCDVSLWTKLTPGEKLLLELKGSSDPTYFWEHPAMGNFPLWPAKKELLTKFFKYEDNFRKYNELIFPAGMRSGKTMTAGLISLTEIYKLLMMKNPQTHYNLTPNTEITTLNVANSRDQAKDTVFRKIKEIVADSPFFMSQEPDLTAYEMKFPKNIKAKALGSALGSAVGRTAKCFVADEIADYDDPQDTYQKLSKATANFAKWGEDVKVMIGSPGFEGDYFLNYYHRAVDEKWPHTLTIWKPSWELNPDTPYEVLVKERMKDPERFDRDFGAQPLSIRENLFNHVLLKQTEKVNRQVRNLFIGEPIFGSRDGFTPALDPSMLKIAPDALDYYMMVDPSIKHDAFGLSIGYLSTSSECKVIGSTVFISPKNEEINTENIKEIFKPILEAFPIKYYIYDVYLHTELRDMVIKYGAQPILHQLNLNDWIFTRNDLYDGRLIVPYSDYLYKEFRQLLVIRNKKADHPPSGSKDQADTIAQFDSFIRRLEEEARLKSDAVPSHFVAQF